VPPGFVDSMLGELIAGWQGAKRSLPALPELVRSIARLDRSDEGSPLREGDEL